MDQKRKNVQSTKAKEELDDWKRTIETKLTSKSNLFYHSIVPFDNTIYTDQTGKFHVRSVRGYNYILVTYSYDANAILVRPLCSRKGSDLVKAIEDIHTYLRERGYKPAHQILDNEINTSLKNFLKSNQVSYQLVPASKPKQNFYVRISF